MCIFPSFLMRIHIESTEQHVPTLSIRKLFVFITVWWIFFFLFGNLFSFARYLTQCLPSLFLSLSLYYTLSPHSLYETLHSIAWVLACKGQNTSLHLLPFKG